MADPERRAPAPAPVRLRPGRLATFVVSVGLTLSAVLGAAVSLFAGAPPAEAASGSTADPDGTAGEASDFSLTGAVDRLSVGLAAALRGTADDPPAGSGTGRRVVYDESAQQVWLIRENESVLTAYPVSGSVHDNLAPGTYEVYSKSRNATSFDYRSTMEYMVRFTQGSTAAIGFHDIPVDEQGDAIQAPSELGTATSSGCIRQRERDARALWRFAPVGTGVVVVA